MLQLKDDHTDTTAAATSWKLQPVREQRGVTSLSISDGPFQIGADNNCDGIINLPGIAKQHCTLQCDGDRLLLIAHDARTWINDLPVRKAHIRAGDRLTIGPTAFQLKAVLPIVRSSNQTSGNDSDLKTEQSQLVQSLQRALSSGRIQGFEQDLQSALTPATDSQADRDVISELQQAIERSSQQRQQIANQPLPEPTATENQQPHTNPQSSLQSANVVPDSIANTNQNDVPNTETAPPSKQIADSQTTPLNGRITQLQRQLDVAIQREQAGQQQVSELQRKLEQRAQHDERSRKTHEQLRNDLHSANQALKGASSRQQQQQRDADFAALSRQLTDSQQALTDALRRQAQCEQQLKDRDAELATVRQELAESKASHAQRQELLDSQQTEQTAARTALEQELNQLRAQVERHQQTTAAQTAQSDEFQHNHRQLEQDLLQTKQAHETLQAELATANEQLSSRENQLEETSAQVSQLQAQLTEAETQLANIQSEQGELQAKLNVQLEAIETARQERQAALEESDDFKTQLAAATQELADTQEQLACEQSVCASAEETIADLETRNEQLNRQCEQFQETVQLLETELAEQIELNQRLDAIEPATENQPESQPLESPAKPHAAAVQARKNVQAALQETERLQAELADCQAKLAAHDDDVAALETELAEEKRIKAELEHQLEQLQDAIDHSLSVTPIAANSDERLEDAAHCPTGCIPQLLPHTDEPIDAENSSPERLDSEWEKLALERDRTFALRQELEENRAAFTAAHQDLLAVRQEAEQEREQLRKRAEELEQRAQQLEDDAVRCETAQPDEFADPMPQYTDDARIEEDATNDFDLDRLADLLGTSQTPPADPVSDFTGSESPGLTSDDASAMEQTDEHLPAADDASSIDADDRADPDSDAEMERVRLELASMFGLSDPTPVADNDQQLQLTASNGEEPLLSDMDEQAETASAESVDEQPEETEQAEDESADVVTTDVVVEDIEDSDSVAAYMQRLFARTNGGQDYQEPQPTAKPAKPNSPPEPVAGGSALPSAEPGGTTSHSDSARAAQPSEPLETLPPRVKVDREHVKREIESLREVANQTARNALATHAWEQVKVKMMASGMLTIVSGLTAVVLISSPMWSPVSYQQYGWLTLLLTVLSGAELFRSRLNLMKLKQKRKSDESKDARSALAAQDDAIVIMPESE